MICQWLADQYMPRLEAEENSWFVRHWQSTTFCVNRAQWQIALQIIIVCKAICHFHETAIARRRKAWFCLCMSRMLFPAKHSWTTLSMSRPFFVGSYLQVRSWALGQWKGRKICIEWYSPLTTKKLHLRAQKPGEWMFFFLIHSSLLSKYITFVLIR